MQGTMGLTPAELQKKAKEDEKERKKREKEEEKRRKKEEEERKKAEKAAKKGKGKDKGGTDPTAEDRMDLKVGMQCELQGLLKKRKSSKLCDLQGDVVLLGEFFFFFCVPS